MIILHRGMDKSGNLYVGYATIVDNICYITTNHGEKMEVDPNTVTPIFDPKWLEANGDIINDIAIPDDNIHKLHRIEDYLDLGRTIISNMKVLYGACYLEDLSTWSDKDLKRLRNLGNVKVMKIRQVMSELGIPSYREKEEGQ